MGQAYRLTPRTRCDMCRCVVKKDKMFLYIYKNQPYVFCDPDDRPCFRNWYSIKNTPDNFRLKGLL